MLKINFELPNTFQISYMETHFFFPHSEMEKCLFIDLDAALGEYVWMLTGTELTVGDAEQNLVGCPQLLLSGIDTSAAAQGFRAKVTFSVTLSIFCWICTTLFNSV